jgi:hypothetical protein
MLNIQLTKEEEHVAKLLKRIRVANELGQLKKLRYWTRVYLESLHAKYASVQRANGQRKIANRLDDPSVRAVAARLNAWKGTEETVLVHAKKKSSNPTSFRTYMAFGIENRALQYLVLRLLGQLADVAPYQYTVNGGLHAAIRHVAKAMSAGPIWAVEVDVVDCFPSFDGKKLKGLLPVPEEVSDHVLISEHFNLKGGGSISNVVKSGPFGPTGDPKASTTLEDKLVEARRGIPQGSAVSPLIAETMLAIALREVPDLGDKVGYGDNILLMAKEEGDMATMLQALESALQAHPVGLLKPKLKLFLRGERVEFLGHYLTPQSGGKIRIEPSEKNRQKFERMMRRQFNRLRYEKLSGTARLEAQQNAKRYVQSWAAAFSLCDGIGDYRAFWLKKVAKASPALALMSGA